MEATLWKLFVAFFRANIVGYGGGPAIIPLIESEVVEKYGWLSGEEFANVLAVGNTLPGPIAPKIAGGIGYSIGGWSGALVAIVATIGPSVLAMVGLYSLLLSYRENPVVSGMIKGVRPVIWVLFLLLALEYVRFVGTAPSIIIAVIAFVMIYFLNLHPALAIIMGLIVGGIALR